MVNITGEVQKIIYQNEETGYSVVKFHPQQDKKAITIVGHFPLLAPGERLEIEGEWKRHRVYGDQLAVQKFTSLKPLSIKGITRYLSSGLIKGIGPVLAEIMVERFGLDILEIIENEPERLLEVPGIGQSKLASIKISWKEQKDTKDLMIFLQTYQIGPAYAYRIYRRYGRNAIKVIEDNPYILAGEIEGIGFKIADRLGQNMGIALNSPLRIGAGVDYVLKKAQDEGHVFLPQEELLKRAEELLTVGREEIGVTLENLFKEKKIVRDSDRIYLPHFYYTELEVAKELKRLASGSGGEFMGIDLVIKAIEGKRNISFSDAQVDAIKSAFLHNVLVLTGGPGTGKTTTVIGLMELCMHYNMKLALASPTGRAAKRLSETTDFPAKTIHRLLEYNPKAGVFSRNSRRQLKVDMVIIDEVSMADIFLTAALLRAIPTGTSLILIGDSDQLPAVGPGNVLADVIHSGAMKLIRLSQIFRQAEESLIVVNAHRINQGQFPYFKGKNKDFYFIKMEEPEQILEAIKSLCQKRLPAAYDFSPVTDIQVMCPMYRGVLGVDNLNTVLQDTLNPQGKKINIGTREFRLGDKVMQIRNNYDKGVFNGDSGWIREYNEETGEVGIDFDNRIITYTLGEFEEIVLSYAITVHKSQGSEYKAVILPMVVQHYLLLQRNLLYTAVTRAKNFVVIIGTMKAMAIALKNNEVKARYTRLAERIKECF
ncbi:MAG: ATP-dependent RecD-like DNA helicase [Candidatus Omnitrophica bacterium]|nr:ATP-dependent RecD-like DNA helicase [Candidatus Omnitrophota bacterium]